MSASGRRRTCTLSIKSRLLRQLSYGRVVVLVMRWMQRAASRDRTGDILFGRQALYQLSYSGVVAAAEWPPCCSSWWVWLGPLAAVAQLVELSNTVRFALPTGLQRRTVGRGVAAAAVYVGVAVCG